MVYVLMFLVLLGCLAAGTWGYSRFGVVGGLAPFALLALTVGYAHVSGVLSFAADHL